MQLPRYCKDFAPTLPRVLPQRPFHPRLPLSPRRAAGEGCCCLGSARILPKKPLHPRHSRCHHVWLLVMDAVALIMQRVCTVIASNFALEAVPSPTLPLSPRRVAGDGCCCIDNATILLRISLEFRLRIRSIPGNPAATA